MTGPAWPLLSILARASESVKKLDKRSEKPWTCAQPARPFKEHFSRTKAWPIRRLMGLPARKEDFQIQVDRSDMGAADTFRYNVLTYVVQEQYDRAIEELRDYLEKESDYPSFQSRIERYMLHAIDLVHAIRAKRNFPGAAYLTMAKQQELNDRFRLHFQELQQVLKRVEKIHIDLKLEDIRSTVYVVRALAFAIGAIALTAFMLDLTGGVVQSTRIVFDEALSELTRWIFLKLGI